MTTPGDKGNPETTETAGRRSTRISIAIPLTISGEDTAGIKFKEKSRTIVINKQGAKISTYHNLTLGADLTVENQLLGRSAQATVVWLGDKRTPRGPLEIGIQLSEAQNLWGIELPPEDWQEGPPIGPGGRRLEEVFDRRAKASAPPASGAPEASTIRLPPAPPQRAATIREPAPAGLDERVRALEERLAALSKQAASGPAEGLVGSATQRGEETLRALDKRVDEVVGLFEAYRSELGTLVARADEIRKSAQGEAEAARLRIQSAASGVLDKAAGELREKIRLEIDAAIQASQEKSEKEAHLRFEKLAQESLDGAVRELRKAAEESRGALTADLKSSSQAVLDESKMSLREVMRETLESLDKEIKAIERDYPAQVLQKLKGYQDQRIHELETHLHQALEKERQAVLKQVQKVGEESALRAVAEVSGACDQVVKTQTEALKSRLAEQSKGAVERIGKEFEGSLGQFRQELQRTVSGILEQSQKAAAANLQEVTNRLLDEAAALLRKQADENMDLAAEQLNEARARAVSQAEAALRRTGTKPAPPALKRPPGKPGHP
jgi:archaellum component FlaC